MSRTQWIVAGAAGLGYAVLTLVGVSIGGKVPALGANSATISADLTGGGLGATYAATYVTGLAAIAFVVLAAFLAAGLRAGGDPTSASSGGVRGGLAATVLGAGSLFAVMFGLDAVLLTGLRYAGHHSVTGDALMTLNTVRNIVLDAGYLALGAFTLAASIAVLAGRALPRWLGWVGLAVGLLLFAAPVAQVAYLISLVWTVVAAIVMATRPGASVGKSAVPATA